MFFIDDVFEYQGGVFFGFPYGHDDAAISARMPWTHSDAHGRLFLGYQDVLFWSIFIFFISFLFNGIRPTLRTFFYIALNYFFVEILNFEAEFAHFIISFTDMVKIEKTVYFAPWTWTFTVADYRMFTFGNSVSIIL